MPQWTPKISILEDDIAEEEARIQMLTAKRAEPVWEPPNVPDTGTIIPDFSTFMEPPAIPQPVRYSDIEFAPSPVQQDVPQPQYSLPQLPVSPPVETAPLIETLAPNVEQPKTKTPEKDYSKELDPLHPFKIDEGLPLWAKTLQAIGKPFEVVQEYLFDPILGVVHQPWASKAMSSEEVIQAKKEGIASYFPGGVRHKAYEQLQYTGKFVAELLPWLIVPPVGVVGAAGKAGTGIAGALSKLGKAGQLAGRALEYSPAGLTEKATGALIGKVTGKVAAKVAPTPGMASTNPLVDKVTGLVKEAKSVIPEQNILNKELRARQAKAANEALMAEGYGERGLRAFAKAFQDKAEKVGFENIAQKLTQKEKDELGTLLLQSGKLPDVFARRQAVKGWEKVLNGELPVDSELEQLEKVFGNGLVEALIAKKPGNVINTISDIANAPRAVLSAVDLSGLLRQGAILTSRYPTEALKSVRPMIKAFFKDSNAKIVDDAIRTRPHTNLLEQGGMYLAPLPGKKTPLSKLEESFMSKWVESIPVIGSMVKASNRAYVTGLNDLRSRVGERILDTWEKMGVKATEVDYKGLGTLINAASGRGSLPKALQGSSPLLNAMMFSPRLFISRLQFPAMLASESPLVRKEAARMLVQFLGAGTSILGMASVLGAKVELDPRSADFAKMKIGNTRLDIWSGYAQWARFLAQLATEQRKTSGGNIVEANRYDVAERFLQSKNSPAAGLLFDILRGESYAGEQVDLQGTNIQRQAYTRLMPLFLQDMIDAIDQEGLAGGTVALPGLFGVGVVTYMSPAQKLRDKLAQERYGMSWEQLGKTQGLAAQLDLERSSPELLALQEKENQEYDQTISGKTDIGNIYRNQTETIEREYRSRINLATQEYRDTKDGVAYKDKIQEIASNRRSQYDLLNKDPQFAKIVARYNELPTPADLKKISPQDFARKEYMRLMYSDDMYDRYENYRFDMIDDMKALFVQTFGQPMLDYVETYQGVKDSDMPPEYLQWKQAQKTLKPYWAVADKVAELYGQTFAESKAGAAFITKQRKDMRATDPEIAQAYDMFYKEP